MTPKILQPWNSMMYSNMSRRSVLSAALAAPSFFSASCQVKRAYVMSFKMWTAVDTDIAEGLLHTLDGQLIDQLIVTNYHEFSSMRQAGWRGGAGMRSMDSLPEKIKVTALMPSSKESPRQRCIRMRRRSDCSQEPGPDHWAFFGDGEVIDSYTVDVRGMLPDKVWRAINRCHDLECYLELGLGVGFEKPNVRWILKGRPTAEFPLLLARQAVNNTGYLAYGGDWGNVRPSGLDGPSPPIFTP